MEGNQNESDNNVEGLLTAKLLEKSNELSRIKSEWVDLALQRIQRELESGDYKLEAKDVPADILEELENEKQTANLQLLVGKLYQKIYPDFDSVAAGNPRDFEFPVSAEYLEYLVKNPNYARTVIDKPGFYLALPDCGTEKNSSLSSTVAEINVPSLVHMYANQGNDNLNFSMGSSMGFADGGFKSKPSREDFKPYYIVLKKA